MNYRRLGRTNLDVSVVGFGTCQLRLVPERQAIETLRKGFELGVNLIHTAPDYEGADDLVARAVRDSGRDIIVCSQGYGPMKQFEYFFETARAKFQKARLELFGIACVDDREALGENVWGRGGMIDFLLRRKADGHLGGIFCTTHGSPAYIQKLIRQDVFDALMVAYNPLGSHLLSYTPSGGREFEHLPGTRDEVFPLASERGIGLMIMKPLAGGLLCRGQAFPPRARLAPESAQFRASDILRLTLSIPGVTCVVPGTASITEAEENALAGHGSLTMPEEKAAGLTSRVRLLDTALCSRCGKCESSCSQGLPVSWLFRAGYLHLFPSEIFEVEESRDYFRLHPAPEAVCATCPDQTCSCPYGLDIPQQLTQVHALMKDLKERGVISSSPELSSPSVPACPLAARVVMQDIPPGPFTPGEGVVIRLQLENTGQQPWAVGLSPGGPRMELVVSVDGGTRQHVALRHDVHPGQRGHFAFTLCVPVAAGAHRLQLNLASSWKRGARTTLPLVEKNLMVQATPTAPAASSLYQRWRASRKARGTPVYGIAYCEHNVPRQIPANTLTTLWFTLENRGTKVWRRNPRWGRPVNVAVFLEETVVATLNLPVETVGRGERITLHWHFRSPGSAGAHELKVDLIEQGVTSFERQGVAPLVIRFETFEAQPTTTSRLMGRALETNCWFSAPTQAITWNREGGTYPIFAQAAQGCRITDVEGREYLDYVMGWGCALLGHAHPRVQGAIRQVIDSGAILSLPHRLEMEVTEALCAAIPCAEMVVFGKNGSDVCTAAARLARVCTGRQKILICGYHGWQDWYVEKNGFRTTGVPERRRPLVFEFPFNNLDAFLKLMKRHRGEVAAVMLEPAGPVEGLNGPLQDADPVFLRGVAEAARRDGALLIFDEIITGFRYPTGSVQKATGVVPDLACLGKGLSAGMPLSALVGRRRFFEVGMERIFFGPTYKGEVYSFAAAREALAVYAEQDVPGHVWSFGNRLRHGVNERCRALGVAAQLIGPPFRMVLSFTDPDLARASLMRTLVQQELLRAGIITYRGFMLPSLAHDEQALEQTLGAFETALGLLARAARDDSFARYLEIPPIS